MKILIIGSGGREHALAWKLAREGHRVFGAPGNPGIAQEGEILATTDYMAAARSLQPDLTIVGPEGPLVSGIVDQFRAAGMLIVGPSQENARLEGSKIHAKQFMQRLAIPTARFFRAESEQEGSEALRRFDYPVVVKADGLAAGKGVVIAQDRAQAEAAVRTLGPRLVIEEFLTGEEASFIALCDGKTAIALEPTQDHKAVFDGDTGPNTGGMGAYCDGRILDDVTKADIMARVIHPAIDHMRAEGHAFTGFLYAGLMMTPQGPKVLEFNARLGDPETRVLMHRMQNDFVEPLFAAANGTLRTAELSWHAEPSVCVVLAAAGYPGSVRTGDAITGLDQVARATVFHAGTKLSDNALVTAGGRVLGVTARGASLSQAIRNTYDDVAKIHFEGRHYRKDIGRRGLKRW